MEWNLTAVILSIATIIIAFPSKYKVLEIKVFKDGKYSESEFYVFRRYAFFFKSYVQHVHQGGGMCRTMFTRQEDASDYARKENKDRQTTVRRYKVEHDV